jgi:predicted alpha/beta-fold hydrolase
LQRRIESALRSYHSGATADLKHVSEHAVNIGYRQVALVGFSLGGNVVLKLLGEWGAEARPGWSVAWVFPFPAI